MSRIFSFAGLRYSAAVAPDLSLAVCPPYDVIAPIEAARLRALAPYNAVHIELPSDGPGEPGSRYRLAAERLRSWLAEGVLRPDDAPTFTLHETRFAFGGQALRRRDVIAAVPVEPWASGTVLPHEQTFSGPKADRLALLRATHANVSPIWLLHREPVAALDRAWAAADGAVPTAEFQLPDGELHRVWVVQSPPVVAGLTHGFARGVGRLYVADGHHRYETALAYRAEAGTEYPGAAATLAVLTGAEDPGLRALPTHRLLRHLPASLTLAAVTERLTQFFHVEPLPPAKGTDGAAVEALMARLAAAARTAPTFGLFGLDDTGAFTSTMLTRCQQPPDAALPRDRSDAWRSLDVAVLHALVVDPLVAAAGRPAEAMIGYTRDAHQALAEVRSGRARLALLLNPTPVQHVLAVADAGDRMPEKSTYFYPKPPTGLVARSLA